MNRRYEGRHGCDVPENWLHEFPDDVTEVFEAGEETFVGIEVRPRDAPVRRG